MLWTPGVQDSISSSPGSFRFFRFSVQYETLPYYIVSDEDMEAQGYVDANGNPDESFLTRYCKIEVDGEDQYLTFSRDQFTVASGDICLFSRLNARKWRDLALRDSRARAGHATQQQQENQ